MKKGITASMWFILLFFSLTVLLSGVGAAQTEGTLKWQKPLQDTVGGVPAVDEDGTVYVTACTFTPAGSQWTGNLYAISPGGTLKWEYPGYFATPAIGSDGTIYVVDIHKSYLYAITPTGKMKWKYQSGFGGGIPAIGSDGTIYLETHDSNGVGITALKPNGSKKWKCILDTDHYIMGAPSAVGNDGTVYAHFSNGEQTPDKNGYYAVRQVISAISPNGTLKWKKPLAQAGQGQWSEGSSMAIADDGTIYVSDSIRSLTPNDDSSSISTFYALNPVDGTVRWQHQVESLQYDFFSNPVIGNDGIIYTFLGSYNLYTFSPDGTPHDSYSPEFSTYYATPAIGSNGSIYTTGYGDWSELVVLNPEGTLKSLYSLYPSNVGGVLSIGNDGTIYACGSDSNSGGLKLLAINSDCKGLANSPWPCYQRNARHTGGPEPMTVNFTATPTKALAPLTVQFTDASTGPIDTRTWDFGDGTSSIEQNPSHTYEKPGKFKAKLTVTNPEGSKSQTVTIKAIKPPAPKVILTATPLAGSSPLTVQFTDASTGNISGRIWSFGDGGSTTDQNPSHTYTLLNPTKAQTYRAKLSVTGLGGTSSKTVRIKVIP
jgi:PKD repeat protein